MTGPAVVRDEVPFEARWYWCEITERVLSGKQAEPDWERVPAEKREWVRARWVAANSHEVTRDWKLWGPQIPFYQRQGDMRVHVVGPV
jgi:hypothetical protein